MAATSASQDASQTGEPGGARAVLEAARHAVDAAVTRFLADRRAELAGLDPSTVALVDEITRLLEAGGKRIRPLLFLSAFRAAGGVETAAVVRAAASLELLHTFAVIHDDVMDDASSRRDVETVHVAAARTAPAATDPARHGLAVAVLVGDLAAVLAEQLLRTSGLSGGGFERALGRFDRMRLEMAAGQYLDLSDGAGGDARVASLKTGSYTASGPILMATALVDAPGAVEGPLSVFGRLVGEAFQLRDDVVDAEAPAAAGVRVGDLVGRAVDALSGAPLEPVGAASLRAIAAAVAEVPEP